MGRATEAMHFGQNGFVAEDHELFTHLDLSSKKTRKEMSEARRKIKPDMTKSDINEAAMLWD